jgi:hypothetical protein
VVPYSPKCVEGVFSEVELPLYSVLRSSLPRNSHLAYKKYAIWVMCETPSPATIYSDLEHINATLDRCSDDKHKL